MSKIVKELVETAQRDTELLFQHLQQGDNLETTRSIVFIFHAATEEKAEVVSSFINENHYAHATYDNIDGEFRILAVLQIAPTQNALCSISGFMVCIATVFSVNYYGWEVAI